MKKVNVGKREDITEIERSQLTFHRHLQDTERYDLYEGEYLKYPGGPVGQTYLYISQGLLYG